MTLSGLACHVNLGPNQYSNLIWRSQELGTETFLGLHLINVLYSIFIIYYYLFYHLNLEVISSSRACKGFLGVGGAPCRLIVLQAYAANRKTEETI